MILIEARVLRQPSRVERLQRLQDPTDRGFEVGPAMQAESSRDARSLVHDQDRVDPIELCIVRIHVRMRSENGLLLPAEENESDRPPTTNAERLKYSRGLQHGRTA